MKYLHKSIACAIMLLSFFNCTTEPVENNQEQFNNTPYTESVSSTSVDECSGEDVFARLTNKSNLEVNFEVYCDSGDLACYQYNIAPTENSGWKNFGSGESTIVVTNNITSDQVLVVEIETNMDYNFVINEDNVLSYSLTNHDFTE